MKEEAKTKKELLKELKSLQRKVNSLEKTNRKLSGSRAKKMVVSASELIQQSEARLKRAELASKSGNWELHLDSKIVLSSEGAEKIYGVNSGPLDYETIKNNPLPEYRSLLDRALKNLIEVDQPYDLEFKIKVSDTGEIKDIHSIAEYDRERNIVFGIIQDITFRKQTEDILRESEERFRRTFEFASIGKAILDIDGNFRNVNNSFCKMIGYSKEELVASNFSLFTHPDDIEISRECMRKLLSGETDSCNYEKRYVKKDGSIVWFALDTTLLKDSKEKPDYYIVHFIDVTNRKYAEKALRESEEKHRTTLYSIGDGVITVDTKGIITNMNYVAEQLTGWYELEAENRPLHEVFKIINEQTRCIVENPVDRVLSEGIIVGLANHTILISKNGDEIPIADSGAPIKSETGEILGVVLVFRDQTEERAAQKSVEDSRRRFLSLFTNMNEGVALHELVYDSNNHPVNYRIIEINPKFEKILGINRSEVLGNLATQAYKTDQAPYLETYCTVALTNKPCIFETYFDSMNKHFFISAVPWLQNGFATIFTDITERKEVEKALKESLEWQKSIFEGSRDAIFISDHDSLFIMVNYAACQLTGYSKKELLQMKIPGLHESLDLQAYLLYHDKIMNGEEIITEAKILKKDGNKIYTEFNNKRIIIDNKYYMHSSARDITERKLAESALRESHALTNAIVESTSDMIWTVDPEKFTLLTFNFSLKEYFRKREGLIIRSGMSQEELFHSDDLINTWKGFYVRALSEGSYSIEYSVAEGTNIFQLTFNLLITDSQVFGISVFSKDITEKVGKEKELKLYHEGLERLVEEKTEQLTKQNVFFRTLIDTIPNPVYVKDMDFRYTEVNKAYEEFFDIKRKDILGKTIFDTAPIETANWVKKLDEQLLNVHKSIVYESTTQVKHNNSVPIMVYKSSFGLPGKKPEGITALVIDISKQKEMEKTTLEALQKEKLLNEMKTNFISMTSHEFRTPLTTILSSAELLAKYYKKWEESKIIGHYSKIQNSVQFMIAMLDEVLIISRSDRGKLAFNPSLLNLKEFTAEIIEQVRMQALPGHNIIFDYKLPYQSINADPKLLNHILSNLLTNSIKFSPAGGDITLLVEDEYERIKFTVSDNGIGIPSEDVPNLFEPFFRARNSAGIKGTGLGLSIVKRYVELHNAEISFESGQGKGTTFIVKIKKENN
jgi:PAS domain S-box-containing protein